MRGLIGKHLSHSFSKEIHEKLDHKEYNLIELAELDNFFHNKSFEAINVTIPYKNDVIKYLDEVDEDALNIGAVNTIVNNNGCLKGYNTDINGLLFTLDHNNISLENKTIGILGNGATSRTIQYLCEKQKVKEVRLFTRKNRQGEYDFTQADKLKDVQILFNATPNGMYPNNFQDVLVDLNHLPNLEFFLDVVYNPLNTSLMLQCKDRGIKAVNGLMMLIHQAVKANELFNNCTHSNQKTLDLYKEVFMNQMNIVLIGMPMSGKTYYSKQVAKVYNKEVIDIDHYIEHVNNMSIPDIFEKYGEIGFRKSEKECTQEISKSLNKAISTGGGVVLNKENIDALRQNGVLIFLDMPLEELKKCNPKGRPLLKNPKNIEKLYKDRYNLYKSYCDIRVIKRGFKRKDTLNRIEVKLNEYISS